MVEAREKIMKKIILWLTCLWLAVSPLSGLAYESPIEAAYGAGALLTTQIQLVPGQLPGADSKAQTIFEDVLNSIDVEIRSQKSANGKVDAFALIMQGEEAFSFQTVEKAGKVYVSSSLLGDQVLTLDTATMGEDLQRLMKLLAEEMGIDANFKMNDVPMEFSQGEAVLKELGEKVVGAVSAHVMKLRSKLTVAQEKVVSDLHDEADTRATITLTGEDVAGLWDAVTDGLMAAEGFIQTLAQSGVTGEDGTLYTGEEAVSYFEKELRRLPETIRAMERDYEVTYLFGKGQLVALQMLTVPSAKTQAVQAVFQQMNAFVSSENQIGEPGGQQAYYYRKTVSGEVTHRLFWKLMEDASWMQALGTYRDFGDKVQGELTLIDNTTNLYLNYGRDAQGFVASVSDGEEVYGATFDRQETAEGYDWSLKLWGGEAQGMARERFQWQEAPEKKGAAPLMEYAALLCRVQGFVLGDMARENTTLDWQLGGQRLAALHIEKKALREEALPQMVSLGDMTDEEAVRWGMKVLSNGLRTLIELPLRLPDSVTSELFGD